MLQVERANISMFQESDLHSQFVKKDASLSGVSNFDDNQPKRNPHLSSLWIRRHVFPLYQMSEMPKSNATNQ